MSQPGRSTPVVILFMLGVGLLAGVAGGYAAGQYQTHFQMPPELQELPPMPSPEEDAKIRAAASEVHLKNRILMTGIIGLIFGGLLGLGLGWVRGSGKTMVLGLILGIVLGGLFGGMNGWTGILIWDHWETKQPDQLTYMAAAAQAGSWIVYGLGVGIGLGLLFKPHLKSSLTLGTTLAGTGLLAGVLCPFLLAVVMPTVQADVPLPPQLEGRIFWASLATVLMAVAAGRVINSLSAPSGASEESAPAVETPTAE